MLFNGDQTLSGTGQIILSDKVTNLISMASYGQTITQEADHTIRGAGQLLSNRGNMVNQGKIIAEGTAALTIDPHANLGFENQGLVSAQGTGGLTHIGSYLQTAGETVVNSLMTVKSNGDFLLQGGGLSGNGVLNFTTDGKGVINSQGTVNPGSSLGKLTIDGNYIQETDGELLIELAGDEQGITYDLLDISGDATLAGTLSVDLLDYTPNVGDIFTIIMAQSIGITPFDALNILDSGILFDVVYTDTDVQLIVSAVPVPSGFLLLISGLLSVTWIKRRVS
ncbi:MAG: hypothetical protein CSA29_04310 [Desulfobacterales bacterium]|nr:MAG: hypothetical protein CSA29_04310 [Desulfobacterales bacterium]